MLFLIFSQNQRTLHIVSTPQEIALADVTRGINMFDKLKVPIFFGIIRIPSKQ